jgi:flagellar biogenesis protein FliO|tara:strand:+ start:1388 stop:1522 length:135 start_codon:yes stop_codon:yes gene_type:complete
MMGLIIALFFVVLFVATQVWMIMKISDLSNRVKNLEKDSGEDKS